MKADKWIGGIPWPDDQWKVKDGYAISAGRDIKTKRAFGDCQLHVEWLGQGRGNNAVFLMNIYEVQVLDSYNNSTYVDGQASAVYKQQPWAVL